jgi:hypothetical protein
MYSQYMEAAGTTVLWRLFRKQATASEHSRAVLLPGGPPYTLAFFANDDMDRVENYETMDVALFRADEIKRSLIEDGWKEE